MLLDGEPLCGNPVVAIVTRGTSPHRGTAQAPRAGERIGGKPWIPCGRTMRIMGQEPMCVDMCVDMCADMCADICACLCVGMFGDMCGGLCVDMCADMCAGLCIDMCADICVGLCVDMWNDMWTGLCVDMWIEVCIACTTTCGPALGVCIGMYANRQRPWVLLDLRVISST